MVIKAPYRYVNPWYVTPLHQKNHRITPPRVFIWSDPVTTSYFIGKGVILFTMFYCSMNWWYYKRMREDLREDFEEENDNKDKKHKNDKNNTKE
jgi:hypothetical protein